MKIEDMHYDFKLKLNAVDSNTFKNFEIPEIDWKLNEAMYIFIMLIANPRLQTKLTFEFQKRSIEDILPLVEDNKQLVQNSIASSGVRYSLPEDLLSFLSIEKILCSKGECKNKKFKANIIRHQEDSNNEFLKPEFGWREVNIRFSKEGLTVFNGDDFIINSVHINYIRKPVYMHYAEGFNENGYKLPNGKLLTNKQDCELPEHTHSEIVDIAVALTFGKMQIPNEYQMAIDKLKLNQFLIN